MLAFWTAKRKQQTRTAAAGEWRPLAGLDYGGGHAALQAARRSALTHHRVFDSVHQADDVGSSSQVFQNLYFPFDLLLLDGLRSRNQDLTDRETK